MSRVGQVWERSGPLVDHGIVLVVRHDPRFHSRWRILWLAGKAAGRLDGANESMFTQSTVWRRLR